MREHQEIKKNRKEEFFLLVEIDIKQKIPFDKNADEHIKDLEIALSQVPRVVDFIQSGEREVWEDLRQSGWGWIPPHNWDDLDNWDYGLCWHYNGDYVGVTAEA